MACASLMDFVKRLTGGDDGAALGVVYANAPSLYEERRAAINAAVIGRPEAEVLEHVTKAMDIAKRIVRIGDAVVKSGPATDPARAIREGAASRGLGADVGLLLRRVLYALRSGNSRNSLKSALRVRLPCDWVLPQ